MSVRLRTRSFYPRRITHVKLLGGPLAGALLVALGAMTMGGCNGSVAVPAATPKPATASSIVATFPTDPHISGTQAGGFSIVGAQPYTLTVTALDADGETIAGPGAPTFTVQSGSGAVSVAAGTSTNTFTVQVKSASSSPVSLTVTPSSGTATSVAVTTVQELWLTNNTGQNVTAYNPLTGT
jgi:hypothetical protein